NRVDAFGRDDIAGKRVANVCPRLVWIGPRGQRIVNDIQPALRVEGIAEIPLLPCGQRHGGQEVVRTALSQTLIIHEEESAVTLDAAAHRPAEEVVLKLAFG